MTPSTEHNSALPHATSGILLLDKPQGVTSNHALQRVKRLLGVRKAGHTGSLDPLATGMLPICCEEATKFSSCLLEADKTYRVRARLGITTTTADADGAVLQRCAVPDFSRAAIESVLPRFRGTLSQVPSMYSALKHQGQPLYKLARQNKVVPRAPRRIHIFSLTLLAQDATTLVLDVHCSKGTYIRNLVEDLGKALGCGAHVAALRRLTTAHYRAVDMVTLAQLERAVALGTAQQLLLSVASAVASWPQITLNARQTVLLQQGQMLTLSPCDGPPGRVALFGPRGFLGIGQYIDNQHLVARRLLRTDR